MLQHLVLLSDLAFKQTVSHIVVTRKRTREKESEKRRSPRALPSHRQNLPHADISVLKRDSTCGLNKLPGDPVSFIRSQKNRDFSDVVRLSSPSQRRPLYCSLIALAFHEPPARKPSVITSSGLSAFTRIFFGPNSFDREIEMLFTAALVAE